MHGTGGGSSVTSFQLICLIVANKLSKLTTYAPIVTGTPATRDAWLSSWLAAGTSVIITAVNVALLSRFKGQTAFQIARRVLGPVVGWVVNLSFFLLFVHPGGLALRQFMEVFAVAMLPETPSVALSILMALLTLYGTMGGYALIGRLAEVVAPAILISVVILILLSYPAISPARLLPVFENGPLPMLAQTLTPIGIFGEMAWTVLLVYPIPHPDQVWTAIRRSTLINGFFVSLGAAYLLSVLGPELIDLELFPTLTATRMIRVAEFVTRIEWLIAMLWMGAMYVKLGLLALGAAQAIHSLAGATVKRWLPPVLGLTVVWSTVVVENAVEIVARFHPTQLLPVSISLELALPLLLLVAAAVRGLRGSGAGEAVGHAGA